MQIELIYFFSRDFPPRLRGIRNIPESLYSIGKKELLLHDKILAIIGSRQADEYGLRSAFNMACYASAFGYVIISGLAYGIDAAAHRGSLSNNGKTIAVLPSGLNYIYPFNNKPLAERIANSGLLISEYEPDNMLTWKTRQEYIQSVKQLTLRNRIITGLAHKVIVIQSKKKSGTMNAVMSAWDQKRKVATIIRGDGKPNYEGNDYILEKGGFAIPDYHSLEEFLRNEA